MFNQCHVSDFVLSLTVPVPAMAVADAVITASTLLQHQNLMYITDAEVGILLQFLSDNINETKESNNV